MFKVILIGAGQLGSRHLQGLAKLDLSVDVKVVDLSHASLETAKKRFEEVSGENNIVKAEFCDSLSKIGLNEADLVIIATNADVRPAVIHELLDRIHVKNLILEKIVFQSVEIFRDMLPFINSKAGKTWINCPRRIYPFYNDLFNELKGTTSLDIEVNGSNWGMGCNSLHFIDLFAYLTSDPDLSLTGYRFDRDLLQSKRAGFYELTGEIRMKNSMGSLTLISSDKDNIPLILTITTPDLKISINERTGECFFSRVKNGGEIERRTFSVPFQSELTGTVARDILLKGACGLTTPEESLKHHSIILPVFTKHFSDITGKELTICPIT
jgi:hypothetical protein